MIDVSRIRYDLVAITPDGQRLHLPEVLRGLTWEEHAGELAQRLTVELTNQGVIQGTIHHLMPLAGHVYLLADWGEGWREVFRGVVTSRGYQTDPLGHCRRVAHDPLWYLMRSEDDRYYPAGTSARAILEDIARAWNLPLGRVDGPDVALAKQVFRSMTVADMITTVLEEARRRGAGKFVLRYRQGQIEIVRAGSNSPVYHFGAWDTVESVSDEENIDNLVTRVRIVGSADDNRRAPIEATLDGATQYGILQKLISSSQYDTPAAARAAAQELLRERGKPERRQTVVAPDLPFLRKGDRVHITAGTLNGYYIVTGVTHDAGSRTMTMEVEPDE